MASYSSIERSTSSGQFLLGGSACPRGESNPPICGELRSARCTPGAGPRFSLARTSSAADSRGGVRSGCSSGDESVPTSFSPILVSVGRRHVSPSVRRNATPRAPERPSEAFSHSERGAHWVKTIARNPSHLSSQKTAPCRRTAGWDERPRGSGSRKLAPRASRVCALKGGEKSHDGGYAAVRPLKARRSAPEYDASRWPSARYASACPPFDAADEIAYGQRTETWQGSSVLRGACRRTLPPQRGPCPAEAGGVSLSVPPTRFELTSFFSRTGGASRRRCFHWRSRPSRSRRGRSRDQVSR